MHRGRIVEFVSFSSTLECCFKEQTLLLKAAILMHRTLHLAPLPQISLQLWHVVGVVRAAIPQVVHE